MPNKDHTGPNGMGPKTGRGAGNCTVEDVLVEELPRLGQGRRAQGGFGAGRNPMGGRGRRNRFFAGGQPQSPRASTQTEPATQEILEAYQAKARQLQETLTEINERICELQNGSTQEESPS